MNIFELKTMRNSRKDCIILPNSYDPTGKAASAEELD